MRYNRPLNSLDEFYQMMYAIPPRQDRHDFTPRLVTKSLLAELGNPQDSLRSVLITGSKGKGSSATMLAHLLSASGQRVGVFSSPHLFDYRERIVVNDSMIGERDLLRLANQVLAVANAIESDDDGAFPRFFEITTAIAYLYFAERGTDFAVIETGIGALTDATNQGSHLLSILTNIESEHINLFGDIQQLAAEKAGVMIKNVPLILGDLPETVDQFIIDQAAQLSVPVTRLNDQSILNNNGFFPVKVGAQLWITDSRSKAQNAWIALNAFKLLGVPLSDEEKVSALTQTKLPAREEILTHQPLIVLDGAHTEQSAKSLANYVDKSLTFNARKKVLMVSFSAIKNISAVLNAFPDINRLVITQATAVRSLAPETVQAHIKAHSLIGDKVRVTVNTDPMLAMQKSLDYLQKNDVLIVAGSVYLAGLISHEFGPTIRKTETKKSTTT